MITLIAFCLIALVVYLMWEAIAFLLTIAAVIALVVLAFFGIGYGAVVAERENTKEASK